MRRGLVCRAWLVCCFARQGLRCLPIPGGKAAAAFTIIAVIVAAAFGFTLYSASKGRLSRSKLILNDAVTEKAGYADFDALGDWVGKQGVAISPLRPAGVVEIEGKRLDVVTRGEFLAEGESVRIAQVEGRQIIVCRI